MTKETSVGNDDGHPGLTPEQKDALDRLMERAITIQTQGVGTPEESREAAAVLAELDQAERDLEAARPAERDTFEAIAEQAEIDANRELMTGYTEILRAAESVIDEQPFSIALTYINSATAALREAELPQDVLRQVELLHAAANTDEDDDLSEPFHAVMTSVREVLERRLLRDDRA